MAPIDIADSSSPTVPEHSSENHPVIYLIRHGEKPPKIDGKDQDGLSPLGQERAEALRQVFGKDSPYNIGYIIAEKPKPNGGRARPFETVAPLAQDLGLTVDISVSRDNYDDVEYLVKKWSGPGNILICWEHKRLSGIAEAIGIIKYGSDVPQAVQDAGTEDGKIAYPEFRFDIIWTVEHPYEEIDSVTSENCEGLDEGHENP